jgi:hypothetical protein
MTAPQFDLKAKYGMRKIKSLEKMKGKWSAKVGVLRGTGAHPDSKDVPIALIAWWNEFGTKRIPSRPFLRTTLREHNYYKQEVFDALKASMRDVARNGVDSQKYRLSLIGVVAANDIQQKISDGPWIPNTAETIRRKSTSSGIKDKPLIARGVLRASIKSAVVKE